MMSLFDNLFLYEIVLLFLGVFLFMLLCGALVYYIIKKEEIKKLLFFFPIAIIMIGYPSVQEIQIENDKFSLRKFSDRVIENPEDTVAQQELTKVTEKLEKRATNTEDLQAVAEANLLLGNSDKAIQLTNKAIEFRIERIEEDEQIGDQPEDSLSTVDRQKEIENIETLEGIKSIATLQKEIKSDPTIIKDSLRLKEKINEVHWKNPKTGKYLNKKIMLSRNVKDTLNKP